MDQPARDWWAPFVGMLGKALGRALIALVIALINPFDTVGWSGRQSHQNWELIQAPAYPGHRAVGRNEITIVSIDQQTLDTLKLKRPLDMRMHALMLDDVMQAAGPNHPPAAVFVDLLFNQAAVPASPLADFSAIARACDDGAQKGFLCYAADVAKYTQYEHWPTVEPGNHKSKCSENIISKINCIRAAGGVPIFFAAPVRGDEIWPIKSGDGGRVIGGDSKITAGQSAALQILDTVAILVPAFMDLPDYPLVQYPGVRDPDTVDPTAGRPDLGAPRLSPAAALYAAHCLGDSPPVCETVPDSAKTAAAWLKTFTKPIDVKWATGGKDYFTKIEDKFRPGFMDLPCKSDTIPIISPAVRFFRLMFHGVHLSKDTPDCPYTHDLAYQDLNASSMTMSDAQTMLTGKLVLIGSTFEDGPDLVPSAPNGALPGVYAHAMALDTLLERGEAYPRSPRPLVSALDLVPLDLIFAAIVLVFSLCADVTEILPDMAFVQRLAPSIGRDSRRSRRLLFIAIRISAPWALVVLIYVFLKSVFEQANVVIGVLAFGDTGLIVAEAIKEPLRARLRSWLGAMPGSNILLAIFDLPPDPPKPSTAPTTQA